jgi:HemK-like putative methylase
MTNDEAWLLKEKYNGIETPEFQADCERLKDGEPLAYVIGWIPFLETKIYLDSHPLIPRTETEFWTQETLKQIPKETPVRILDLCAGSGCIGVALLHALPFATVDFGEIETHHHQTIRKNIMENGIDPTRAHIYGGDLFEQITETYDYIFTNPPYIDPKIDRAEESVKDYEPASALYGGKDGMELIERIIKEASNHLTPRGTLYIEHEPEQVALIQKVGEELGFMVESQKDQYGIFRYTRVERNGRENVAQ